MSLDDKFNAAVKIVQNLPKDGPLTTSTSQKLTFYSLFKQATVGDCNTERPGMLAFTEKAKWDAWNGVKGMSAEEAKQKYVDEINSVFDSAAEKIDIESWLNQIDPCIKENLALLGKH